MTDRWERVGRLFDAAVALPDAERARFVSSSGEPEDVRREVLSLIASHDAASDFLEKRPSIDDDVTAGNDGPGDAPEPPPLPAGTMVGPYQIKSIVGSGGMGVVYEAYDTRLLRRVAVKSLSPRVSRAETQRERLKQEARAAAALAHPGIAVVYALEEVNEQLFIVSELLEGETLRAVLEREGVIALPRALAMTLEIADALAAAHERGIIHRDLKPENIICTPGGRLKILDFGLAQFEGAARDLMSITRLTEPGLVAGTPPYMAPEQLLGQPTDARTDQFALGVILYEMCTGRHPFGGTSLPSTIARILAGDPLPPPQDDSIPPHVWNIVQRLLQKEPAARFASTPSVIDSLSEAVSVVRTGSSSSGQPPAAARAPALQSSVTGGSSGPSDALRWWRFHQLAATLGYAAMAWPAWHVQRSLGRAGLFFFFSTVAAIVVASSLRLHLWFSSRVYPEDLETQRAEVARWIRGADLAFAALLIAGGIALPPERVAWAALLISFGSAAAVVALFVEPATARAAFRRRQG